MAAIIDAAWPQCSSFEAFSPSVVNLSVRGSHSPLPVKALAKLQFLRRQTWYVKKAICSQGFTAMLGLGELVQRLTLDGVLFTLSSCRVRGVDA